MLPDRSAADPQLSALDGPATLALCNTLADYGEAGALSHELMLRAGQYATTRFATDLAVLRAVARMYRLGGELELARKALIRAGKLAPEEAETLLPLGEVLRELGLPVAPALAIAEADVDPADATTPTLASEAGPPEVRSQSYIRSIAELEGRASDVWETSTAHPLGNADGAADPHHPPGRDSEAPARKMPPIERRTELAIDDDLPAPATSLEAKAVAAPGGAPLRRVSSGTLRAVDPASSTAPRSTLRHPQRPDTQRSEVRSPSGALRLPESLRAPSGPRPGESSRAPASVGSSESARPRDRARSPGRDHPGGRSSDSLRALESVRAPETPRPPRACRIRMLDPRDPARRLDRYELIGEIASGGMATVFLARRDGAGGFQRLVAIKRLHPHLAHQDEFVEMFLDEARLAAAIHHPHVVPILESENGSYVVMEFIEGDTLAGLSARALARGVMLPRAVAVRIVLDALAGLHAAHQLKDSEGRLLGLVHRDCTPQNILVGSDGSSRLTDFGVARAAARLAITRSRTVKGKVAYLSPEQATAGELDRRSDLFTMGIVLWEALAGRPLFLTDNDATTVARLLSGPIPSVRQFAPDVSPDLDDICARALQRNPARRYPTAAAMAEALETAARYAIGGAGSSAEVGRCVEMLIGNDLAAQRDAVRAWTAQAEAGPESRRRGSTTEMASVRAHLGEIPRPPPLPQALLDEAMSGADRPSQPTADILATLKATPTTHANVRATSATQANQNAASSTQANLKAASGAHATLRSASTTGERARVASSPLDTLKSTPSPLDTLKSASSPLARRTPLSTPSSVDSATSTPTTTPAQPASAATTTPVPASAPGALKTSAPGNAASASAARRDARALRSASAKTRVRLLVALSAVLLIGATSPLWVPHVLALRHTLLARVLPHPTVSTASHLAAPPPLTTTTSAVVPAEPITAPGHPSATPEERSFDE